MMTPEAFKDVLQNIKQDLQLTQQQTQQKVAQIQGNIPRGNTSGQNSLSKGNTQTVRALSPQGTPIEIPNDEALIEQLLESEGSLV